MFAIGTKLCLGERQEMDDQSIAEQLPQLLMKDWDNRSTMVKPLLPLTLATERLSFEVRQQQPQGCRVLPGSRLQANLLVSGIQLAR